MDKVNTQPATVINGTDFTGNQYHYHHPAHTRYMENKITKWSVRTGLTVCCMLGILARNAAQTNNVEAFIQQEMKERRIPGLQLAVVQHGKIVLQKSFGIANIQHAIPVNEQSIFSINSCTKAFTGVAIMQLVEEGKIDIALPVSHYLEGLPAAWQPVTIRQLLTHVSGLPNILADDNTGKLVAEGGEEAAWNKVITMPMEFVTGERYRYNQTNFILLGKIIDKLSNKPFAQVFRERQFAAAGMTHTGFGDSRDVIKNKTQSYRYYTSLDGRALAKETLTNVYEEFPPFRRTASGMNSTAADLARWLIALQHGKLLKTKAALTTLFTPGTFNNGTPTQWSLGWRANNRAAHPVVMATGGSRSAFCIYSTDDIAIVILTNLVFANPEQFMDAVAGYYIPGLRTAQSIHILRTQLSKRGFAQAMEVIREEKKKNAWFNVTETAINEWGYRVLATGQHKKALDIFKLNVTLHPTSWNVYDSYGEALLKNGQKEEAIKMYERSLELNPNNEGGRKVLKDLQDQQH
jgi:CubicO group peptidase (beta-lactamase class C family)